MYPPAKTHTFGYECKSKSRSTNQLFIKLGYSPSFNATTRQQSLFSTRKETFLHALQCKGGGGQGGEITPFHIIQFGRQSAEVFLTKRFTQVQQRQFGRGILKMVGPKKQAFCPRINMLKGNFDTNYFEPLMIFSSLQKTEFLKLIVLFLHYFWHQI